MSYPKQPHPPAKHYLLKSTFVAALWKNNWFKAGIKVAIAIGEDADTEVLAKFTGNIERVIRVHDVETLKKVIRVVAVTSSQVGSASASASAGEATVTKEDTVTEAIKDQLEEEKVEIGTDLNTDSANDDEW